MTDYHLHEICKCANSKKLPIRKYGAIWKCGRCGLKILDPDEVERVVEEARIREMVRVYKNARRRGAKIDPPDEIKDYV
jgi:ribosomal protein L37AE/L43A